MTTPYPPPGYQRTPEFDPEYCGPLEAQCMRCEWGTRDCGCPCGPLYASQAPVRAWLVVAMRTSVRWARRLCLRIWWRLDRLVL